MSVQTELDAAFEEVADQIKARTAPGSLGVWGLVPTAIISNGATLPSPLPAWGVVIELEA